MTSEADTDTRPDANGSRSALEIRQLRAFLAVASHGSVSAAASKLGLAQSTVSESLAALDRAVGTPTIARGRGVQRIALTDAGNALLPHARRVLHEIEIAHHSIASIARNACARMTIAANESVSTHLLPSALGDLRARWPSTRFAVSVAACDEIRSDVARCNCDLGLLFEGETPAHDARRPAHTISNDVAGGMIDLTSSAPLVIFSAPQHPLARREQRSAIPLNSVAQYPMVAAAAAGNFHDLLLRYFASEQLIYPQLELVGSIEAVRRAVQSRAQSLGILPLHAIASDLESGKFRGLDLNPAPPRVRLVALLPRTRVQRHPSVGELLDALHQS